MAANYMFCRQEAEALVDLCEANPDFQIHDKTCMEFAAELRALFGMCDFATSQRIKREMEENPQPGHVLEINVQTFRADFDEIRIIPPIP